MTGTKEGARGAGTGGHATPEEPNAPAAEAARGDTGTVRRVLMVLTELIDNPTASANATAKHLQLPRSTVHRLLTMLKQSGFADQRADGSFAPGPELHRLAGRLRANVPHAELATPVLQELATRVGETCVLAILTPQSLGMYFAATASPPDPMRYNVELHRVGSLAWGATGRAILAHLPPDDIDVVVLRDEKSPVGARSLDRVELARELAQIRKDGYAISRGHRTPHAVGVAVPFFAADGSVVGDVSCLIPEGRFREKKLRELVRALRDAATQIGVRLGYLRPNEPAPPSQPSPRGGRSSERQAS
jgi:DNA-binding IclR family transcriptional regulator